MDYRDFTAKSVDEAITMACLDLGVTSDHLEYSIVQEATSGFLGIGSKPAVIKARVREEVKEEPVQAKEAEPEKKEADVSRKAEIESVVTKVFKEQQSKKEKAEKQQDAEEKKSRIITNDEIEKRAAAAAARAKNEGVSEEKSSEKEYEKRENRRSARSFDGRRRERFDEKRNVPHHEPSKPKPERVVKKRTEEEAAELTGAAETFLKDVFGAMGIEAVINIDYDYEEGAVNAVFSGDEMGLLIGKRGQTLDSLQYLTSLVVNKKTDEYVRVKLDTEDYRSRRAETLNNLARNIAFKVKKTRRPVALEPMNPYERRIIHYALQSNKFVETYSEGEEPYRHVVVAPKW